MTTQRTFPRPDTLSAATIGNDLMRYFTRLNELIGDYSMKLMSDSDVSFLKGQKVTDIAIEASVRLFITDEAELSRVVEGIKGLLQK